MPHWTDKRWKGIVIDWPTIAEMDSEDYELKPLNQQQVAILLALLEYQKWPTRWTGLELDKSELETYIADIEQRLMRNEGGGMATKDDIRDGIVEAFVKLSIRVASGEEGDVCFDENGQPIEGGAGGAGSGGADLPEDDPTTPIDETESARYGAMLEIAAKLELVLDKIDTLFGVDATADTPEQDAQDVMKAYFPCDETLMAQAVTSYYSWRIVPNSQFAFNGSTSFPQYLYCNGYDMNTLNRYLLDVSAYTINKVSRIGQFWEALSDSFFSQYYSKGQEKPSNAYLDAACVPMQYQEYLNVPYASQRTLVPAIAKAGHRLLIQVSGHYVDPDGDIQDAFWYRTAAGALTRSNFNFSHGAGSNMPSDNQVPYNTTHVYEYTIDLFNGASSWSVQFNKNAGMAVASTSPTNGFSIKITDLGAGISA